MIFLPLTLKCYQRNNTPLQLNVNLPSNISAVIYNEKFLLYVILSYNVFYVKILVKFLNFK